MVKQTFRNLLDHIEPIRFVVRRLLPGWRLDFFVTNSNATLEELRAYLEVRPTLRTKPVRAASFPLGGSVPRVASAQDCQNVACFENLTGFTLLAVGTIEPRKNYQCILDAFDLLVEQKQKVSLIIVGRKGWKCNEIIQRLATHPLRGRSLVHLDDADDDMLACAYQRAHCLVSASWNEGFGLPVVEGLMHGLPVLASDIPAFREIGGGACTYFRPDSPEDLMERVIELASKRSSPKPDEDGNSAPVWINWMESTAIFKERVLELTDLPAGLPGKPEGRV